MATSYEVTRTIDASADKVWNLLIDASGYAKWNPAVVSLEGPIKIGNRLRLVSIVNPKRTFKPKVVALDAPRRMVWADGMPLGLFKGERVYTLDSLGPTSTRFHMREAFTGPLAGMISKSIPDMTDSFNQFADGLKKAAENGG